uniref:Uncharacterized protein n=1 Tax=Meleagris gallopavo TaxID=9103 RepID=A0A803Y1I4_MELGA
MWDVWGIAWGNWGAVGCVGPWAVWGWVPELPVPQARNEPDVYETSDLPEDDQAEFEAVRLGHGGAHNHHRGHVALSVVPPPHRALFSISRRGAVG